MSLIESTFVDVQAVVPGGVVARLLFEKYAEREAQVLEKELVGCIESRGWRAAIDMGEVGMLASVGLGSLLNLHKACAAGKGKLVLFNVRPEIVQVMKLTHLDRVLTLAPTREAALKAIA